jgi:hypothetical protein
MSWRYVMTNGVRRLQQSGNSATTDDRGEYRLHNLQPGDYLVSAAPAPDLALADRALADAQAVEQAIVSGTVQAPAAPGLPPTVTIAVTPPGPPQPGVDNTPPGYLPIYYPSTPLAENASMIHVAGGDEHRSADIQIQLVQASIVEGTIANPLGQDVSIQVSLQNTDPVYGTSTNTTRTDPSGKFTFRSVAPGKYTVLAQTVPSQRLTLVNGAMTPPPPGPPPQLDDSQKYWARRAVTVEGQSKVTVNLELQPGRSISGVVLFNMEHPPDLSRTRLTVMLTPAPSSFVMGALPQTTIGADGRFALNGVIPGKYTLRANAGLLKSSIVNGEDTLDFPLDFTGETDVTDAVLTVIDPTAATEVGGKLTDALGKPGLDYTVVAATTDQHFWTPGSRRIAIARPGPDGQFIFRNLPPGDYLIAAATDLDPGAQYDPEFLKTLTAAATQRITLGEGGKVNQDLRVR